MTMDYLTFLWLGFLCILAALAVPIPFMLHAARWVDEPPLMPRGCFETEDEYIAYMIERCKR